MYLKPRAKYVVDDNKTELLLIITSIQHCTGLTSALRQRKKENLQVFRKIFPQLQKIYLPASTDKIIEKEIIQQISWFNTKLILTHK